MSIEQALRISGLEVSFRMYSQLLGQTKLRVIHNFGLTLNAGEILAVAGSSGSGKSLLAHAILGILPRNAEVSGEMTWFGEPLTEKLKKRLRGHELALVPQSVEYLDPIMRVGRQISKDKSVVEEVLSRYKLQPETAKLYPFQLSGGMARRVLVSTAVVSGAKVIVADEPTPGMSKELADKAMKHFRDLANDGTAVLLITHDIDLALGYADRVAVFYAGMTVETSKVSDWAESGHRLRHPYSQALWQAMPKNGFAPHPGVQPYAGNLPSGCLFAPRCAMASDKCYASVPELRQLKGGEVCCHHAS